MEEELEVLKEVASRLKDAQMITDTSIEMQRQMLKMLEKKSPTERLKMASRMFETSKRLIKSGLQHERKEFTEAQLRGRTLLRLYSDSFTKDELEKIAQKIPNLELI